VQAESQSPAHRKAGHALHQLRALTVLVFTLKLSQYSQKGSFLMSTPTPKNMSAPTPQNRSRTATAPAFSVPAEEKIRTRAYQLYEERGRQDGHAMEDWLQAEAEITSVKGRIHVA
jgi:DUF2934 family protein